MEHNEFTSDLETKFAVMQTYKALKEARIMLSQYEKVLPKVFNRKDKDTLQQRTLLEKDVRLLQRLSEDIGEARARLQFSIYKEIF